MNNAKKEKGMLPVKYPVITSYTSDAHMLAILNSYPSTEEWIFNHYINLWGEAPLVCNGFSMLRFHSWSIRKSCPYFKISNYDKKFFGSAISEFIIAKIDAGNYVATLYDPYYIQASNLYKKVHIEHEMLICGYDRKIKMFYIADFFENNRYTFTTAPFDCVEQAISHVLESELFSFDEIEYHAANYKFSYYFFYNSLNNFLSSKNTAAENENVIIGKVESEQIQKGLYIFGINNYRLLKQALSETAHDQTGFYLLKSMHVLYDHKVMMCERLKYLSNAGRIDIPAPIADEYENIKNLSLINRNLFLKYIFTRDYKLTDKIINNTTIIESLEIETITELIKIISANTIL